MTRPFTNRLARPLAAGYDVLVMSETNHQKTFIVNKWLLAVAAAVLIGAGIYFFEPIMAVTEQTTRFLLDKEGARRYFETRPLAPLYYIGLQALQVVISPIPGELSGILAGMIFGWLKGFILATIGLTIGSAVNVTLGRLFERVFLEKVLSNRVLDRFEEKAQRYGLLTVFILFVFPGAPKDTFCWLFGLTRIPIWAFLLVSSIARMPGTLVLALQGDKAVEGQWLFLAILTGVGVLLSVFALLYRERLVRLLKLPRWSGGGEDS
jgi:uncharacterized membrane protein YdjX (TVP38/TMEM64 family)